MQEVLNFVTEDEANIYSENFKGESNEPHRTVTSSKIIILEITTLVVIISATSEQ